MNTNAYQLSYFLGFFEVLGLCSVRLRFILGIIINLVVILILLLCYHFNQSVVNKHTFMEYFNDGIHLFVCCANVLCIYIETIHKRSEFQRFFASVSAVDQKFRGLKLPTEQFNAQLCSFYLRCFTTVLSIVVTIEILIIFNIGIDQQWISYWFVTSWPMVINRCRLLQISLFVGIPALHLQLLERALNQMRKLGYRSRRTARIKYLKNMHLAIVEELNGFNKMFNYSLAFHMLQNFVELLSGFYWLYYYYLDNHCVFGEFISSPT